MAQSMFNLDTIRKAKQSYKANPTTTPTTNTRVSPIQAMTNATNLAPTKTMTPNTAASAAQKMMSVTSPSRTEQTLGNISSAVNTPFTYDADSDQAYQADVKAAQQNLAVNQKNTNAQLRATGQGKSSYSETVANQLANQTTENIANNILPQYAQQAYGRYQDNIANQGNLYGLQYQQDVTTPQNEAQLTGNYLPPEAKTAINNLLGLKTQAETKGITAGERSVLSTEADKLRSQLKSLGIDPSFYGADKTAAQASSTNPGIRTLDGQSQDQSVKNANLDAATAVSNMTGKVITPQTDWQGLVRQAANPNTPLTANQQMQTEQFAYQKARDAISDKQWQQSFDYNKEQGGLDYALRKLSQQNDQSYRQAQLALSEDDNSRAWATLDYQTSQPTATKYSGMTANQVLNNIKEAYQEPVYTETVNPVTKEVTKVESGKTKLTTDPTKLSQMFESVVGAGLSEAETKQVLLSLGMSMKDIEARAKSYSGN